MPTFFAGIPSIDWAMIGYSGNSSVLFPFPFFIFFNNNFVYYIVFI